jgi:hypothetical protein
MVSNEARMGMNPIYIPQLGKKEGYYCTRFDDMMVDEILFVTTWRNPVAKLHYRGQWGTHWWLTRRHTDNHYLQEIVRKGDKDTILTRQDIELAK